MKRTILLLTLFTGVVFATSAQEAEKAMEARAREFVRVIGLSDQNEWKKFIESNYTKAFIERPMQAKRDTGEGGSANKQAGTVEGKARMFEMLHNDFGNGKITDLKVNGNEVAMTVSGVNLTGKFNLKFAKEKPWLMDGIGVEVGN